MTYTTRYALTLLGFLTFVGGGCLTQSSSATNEDRQATFQFTYPIAKDDAICRQEPRMTDIGSLVFASAVPYDHLNFLGQFFTGYQCGRLPDDGTYDLGSTLQLNTDPSQELLETLQNIGFKCTTDVTSDACTRWELDNFNVPNRELIKLENFVDEMKSDDCVNCG